MIPIDLYDDDTKQSMSLNCEMILLLRRFATGTSIILVDGSRIDTDKPLMDLKRMIKEARMEYCK